MCSPREKWRITCNRIYGANITLGILEVQSRTGNYFRCCAASVREGTRVSYNANAQHRWVRAMRKIVAHRPSSKVGQAGRLGVAGDPAVTAVLGARLSGSIGGRFLRSLWRESGRSMRDRNCMDLRRGGRSHCSRASKAAPSSASSFRSGFGALRPFGLGEGGRRPVRMTQIGRGCVKTAVCR
jgi:hypothetical protein